MTTADLCMLLNVMPAHTSLTRSWGRQQAWDSTRERQKGNFPARSVTAAPRRGTGESSQPRLGCPGTGEDGGVSQRVADGHIATKGHGQEHRGLHEGERTNKINLSKTGVKTDFPAVGPENTQHSWCCRQREAQISHGQHGEELAHGLAEARMAPDDKEDRAVPREGRGVDAGERDGEPDLGSLQRRDACQDERVTRAAGAGGPGNIYNEITINKK